jgi:flagella basal body P-ring formation protein FlgA
MAVFHGPLLNMKLPLKLVTALLFASQAIASLPAAAATAAALPAATAAAAPATPAPAAAPATAAGRQSTAVLRSVVEQFLRVQSAGLPGEVSVTVTPVDSRLNLAACPVPQAFLAPGSRAWGKTTVGVRCTAPNPWTTYIQASVSVMADYVASAVPLAQGQPIEQSQLISMRGDLTALPAGIATDMSQVIGRSVNISLPSGTPMRLDVLRSKPVVQQGQLVRLVSSGAGFRVSAEGRSIGTAGEGQIVQVRTPSGQQISGVARAGGMVEVTF